MTAVVGLSAFTDCLKTNQISMDNSTDSNKTIQVLRNISSFLKSNDIRSIENEILGVGFEKIISKSGVELARAIQEPRLVVFLLSLARENDVKFDDLDHWYTVYHSIISQDIKNCVSNKATKNVVNAILNDFTSSEFSFKDFSSKSLDVKNLELLVDFKKWEILLTILKNLPVDGPGLKICLSFLKIIVIRQRFIVLPIDRESFSEIYELMLNKLAPFPEISKTISAIKIFYASSLQSANETAAALNVYESCHDEDYKEVVLFEKARCKSKSGQYDEALQDLDNLICFLIEADQIGKTSSFRIETPADINYTSDNAIKAYSDIAMLSQAVGAELFMVSGTLLGFCRSGDFLPNDKDLDFGLIGLDKLFRLMDLSIKSNLFKINTINLKGEDTLQVPFIHVPTGIWIDVFIYHEYNDCFVTGVDFQFGYRQKFKFSKFNPVPVVFHGIETFIPSNSNENLKENFSDWEIPDPNYISHLESPSILNFGDLGHRISSRMWAVRAIQSKSIEKLKKIIAVISKMNLSEDTELLNQLISTADRFESIHLNPLGVALQI